MKTSRTCACLRQGSIFWLLVVIPVFASLSIVYANAAEQEATNKIISRDHAKQLASWPYAPSCDMTEPFFGMIPVRIHSLSNGHARLPARNRLPNHSSFELNKKHGRFVAIADGVMWISKDGCRWKTKSKYDTEQYNRLSMARQGDYAYLWRSGSLKVFRISLSDWRTSTILIPTSLKLLSIGSDDTLQILSNDGCQFHEGVIRDDLWHTISMRELPCGMQSFHDVDSIDDFPLFIGKEGQLIVSRDRGATFQDITVRGPTGPIDGIAVSRIDADSYIWITRKNVLSVLDGTGQLIAEADLAKSYGIRGSTSIHADEGSQRSVIAALIMEQETGLAPTKLHYLYMDRDTHKFTGGKVPHSNMFPDGIVSRLVLNPSSSGVAWVMLAALER